jgi:hypothetical protein
MGLRKLLTRQPADPDQGRTKPFDPIERFRELGRTEDPVHPSRQFPGATTQSDAASVSAARVDEKAADFSGGISKKKPSRSRSGYMWVSQRSRDSQATFKSFVDQRF